ncbi:MAG: helix-hairpin-helix domain-containing protein [Thiothrix sp.]
MAEAIVAARPFASMNALLKVKGFGQKTLEKLGNSITL